VVILEFLYDALILPFVQMAGEPVFFVNVVLMGLMTGFMYALVALGFALIFKASEQLNFAQGVMIVLAALTLVELYELPLGEGQYSLMWGVIAAVGLAAFLIGRFATQRQAVPQSVGAAAAPRASGGANPMRVVRSVGLTLFYAGLSVFLYLAVAPEADGGIAGAAIGIALVVGTLIALRDAGVISLGDGLTALFEGGGVMMKTVLIVGAVLVIAGLWLANLPVWVALVLTVVVMFGIAGTVEPTILRPLVNQDPIILFMVTIGLTFFFIGMGEFIFGGDIENIPAAELGIPRGPFVFGEFLNPEARRPGIFLLQQDIAAAGVAAALVGALLLFFRFSRLGRALRAVADDHQAAQSVGIPLKSVWVVVWAIAGVVAIAAGIFWGLKGGVGFGLQIVALKALPVLILGGFTSVPGVIVGGLIIGVAEKLGELYWQDAFGRGIEGWFAYMVALLFLVFRPQGLFGEKIIERV